MAENKIKPSFLVLSGLTAFLVFWLIEAVFYQLFSPKYSYFYLFSLILYIVGFIVLGGLAILCFKICSSRFDSEKIKYMFPYIFVYMPVLIYGFFQIVMIFKWPLLHFYSIILFLIIALLFVLVALLSVQTLIKSDKFTRGLFYSLAIILPFIVIFSNFSVVGEILYDFTMLKFGLAVFFFIFMPLFSMYLCSFMVKAWPERKAVFLGGYFFIFLLFVSSLWGGQVLRDKYIYRYSGQNISQNKTDESMPNVIFIVMDTARRDRFSCYGYDRKTENFDQFASKGVLFTNVISTAPWTLPSHAAMFTGFPSYVHNATHSNPQTGQANYLSDGFTTLAEVLQNNGYRTGAVVSNTAFLAPWSGLNQGFGYYRCSQALGVSSFANIIALKFSLMEYKKFLWKTGINDINDANYINTRAQNWIAKTRKTKPFFLFLNYMEPHGFYYLPKPFSSQYTTPLKDELYKKYDSSCKIELPQNVAQKYSDWYDNQIASLDVELGNFLSYLKENDLYDNSLIIMTSDHGHLMGEHEYFGHDYFLYEELLRVPMAVKYPKGTVVNLDADKTIQNFDIYAEILSFLNLEHPPVISQPFASVSHPIFAEVRQNPRGKFCPQRFGKDLAGLYGGDDQSMKIISGTDGSNELYDVKTDPLEQNNLIGPDTDQEPLLIHLEKYYEELGPLRALYLDNSARKNLKQSEIDRLRALGYIK